MSEFLDHWQSLIGAIIGAATPIMFWFIVQTIEKISKRKNDLILLYKMMVTNINTLCDAFNTIKIFLNGNLNQLLIDIESDNTANAHSASHTYFPLFICNPIDIDLITITSGSGYLDNKLLIIHTISKDFALGIEDIRSQFRETMLLNREMAFNKLNPYTAHNDLYKSNISHFKNVVERDILQKNIKTYLRLLVESLVVLKELRRMSLFAWKFKFSGSFKYFKSHKEFKEYININNVFIRIDELIRDDVDRQYTEIESKLIR